MTILDDRTVAPADGFLVTGASQTSPHGAGLTTALSRSTAQFARPHGPDLLGRTEKYLQWQQARRDAGVWPFSRCLGSAPRSTCVVRDEQGNTRDGINFGSQDYLSLSLHPAVLAAAERALREFGPHSAGSPMLTGNTDPSLALEADLGEALQMEHVMLFPTGWAAGFGTIVGLVRPDDHVLLDNLSHACLQQGAQAATANVRRHGHLDLAAIRSHLSDIRSKDSRNGILVVTEGLFSMDSDCPALGPLQDLCHEYSATLLVDVAHDFGASGPRGTGTIGSQNLLGKVDLVMGAFSKTFAANGGFLATRSESVKQFVKMFGGTHTFSNAISPLQAAVVVEALRIVRSAEGEQRRGMLLEAVRALRDAFAGYGIRCMGDPSAIVPVPVGSEKVGRLAYSLVFDRGVFANLVEFPAVAIGASRFRMQVMAEHTGEQIQEAARVVAGAIDEAQAMVNPWTGARPANKLDV
uniref:Palmitoyltransferase-like protein n=1 Tax=uncultured Armatimonadetes bacterium TaxID=157466 RepID=A0A6J4J0Q7_9BACT|nr:Palmitoyltransferase-like protein [uncultured Armatimonadetes bacterium]